MSTSRAIRIFVVAAALAGGTALAAGCGGDTLGDNFGLDAAVATDATVPDAGMPDTGVLMTLDGGPTCQNGLRACGNACVDEQGDGANCGECGVTCAIGTVCSEGACATSCAGTLTACGTSCVDTSTDTNNCGACGTSCGAGLVCANGACSVTCETGETLCTSSEASTVDAGSAASFCIDTHSDRNNCGGCGVTCAAGQVCSGGTCATTCSPGFVDCNGSCVDPNTSRGFCGATAGCGITTADAGVDAGTSAGTACAAGQVCSAGSCQVSCGAGLVLCNGTCVDPRSNPNFCGATAGCGIGAGTPGIICTQGQVCAGTGVCQTSCASNQVRCGSECIDPTTSNVACGAKGDCSTSDENDSPGAACTNGQVCSNGVCSLTCAAGRAVCGGGCVNGQTDSVHCGASGDCTGVNAGVACPAGQVCTGGSCAITCQATQVQCGTDCIDPATSLAFCGARGDCSNDGKPADSTGTACVAGKVCNHGVCATACSGTLTTCNGACVNEQTDNQNCGACNTVCAAGTVCTSGACIAQCTGTLQVCSNACVDQQNDPAHCGSCSACVTQTEVNVTDCRAGVCAIGTCAAGYADCNGTYGDGCESQRATDAMNCGACGVVCASGVCSGGTCAAASCAAILAAQPTAADGVYTIKPASAAAAFQVYCDMTRDGGGWTLVMKTSGSTTFTYSAAAWTDASTLNVSDFSLTDGTDAKYASFNTVPMATLRGEFPAITTPYRFQKATTGSPTAQALFSGTEQAVSPYPFTPPVPPFSVQPNCQYFGINNYGNNAALATLIRFGWTGNNESDCSSNDSLSGFGLVYPAGGQSHGSGFVCQSTGCSNGDEDLSVVGLLWVK